MKRQLICKGYPSVEVSSLNRTFKHNELIVIDVKDITAELKEKIAMGLFEYVTRGVTGSILPKKEDSRRNQFFRESSAVRNRKVAESKNDIPPVSALNTETLSNVFREIVREELKNISLNTVNSTPVSSKQAVKKVVKDILDDTVLFVRPEERELTGSIQVEEQAEAGIEINSAIDKLKKKGKKNVKNQEA